MRKMLGWKNVYVVWSLSVVVFMVIGIIGCNSLKSVRKESPTAPSGSAVELGNFAQQSGQSRVVTVNGATHQINGVISGSVVAGGLYIEINEQSATGQPAGTAQVPVSLQNVTLTFTALPSDISAITVKSGDTTLGAYAVSDGSVEIALSAAQWAQWFGASHYAVVCVAVGISTADWEVDGPHEWNQAWEHSRQCARCRENLPNLEDFASFQAALRQCKCLLTH